MAYVRGRILRSTKEALKYEDPTDYGSGNIPQGHVAFMFWHESYKTPVEVASAEAEDTLPLPEHAQGAGHAALLGSDQDVRRKCWEQAIVDANFEEAAQFEETDIQ